MSVTIGAALKKIAVALLTDKKVIKTIGGIIIGIIIIVVMPIIAVVSVFNGSMDIDTDKLGKSIQENISAEQMENLQNNGGILATFASCRLLKEKSEKYPKSNKSRNRAVCGKV